MILQLAIFTLLCSLARVRGSCDTCQANFVMCRDERSFSLCLDGTSQSEVRTCPIGYVCTSEPEICSKRSATNSVQPACGTMCGLCESPENLFTCLSESVYAYCFGELEPDYRAQGICPNGFVCNFNSLQICTPASEGSSCYTNPSSSTTDVTTTSSSSSTEKSTTEISSTSSSDATTPQISSTPEELSTTTQSVSTTSSDATTEQISSSTKDSSTSNSNPTTTSTSSSPTVTSTDFETTTSSQTSTSESSQTISTTSRPKDEHDFCRENQVEGFFKDESDSTCKQFIFCYVMSGEYLAMKFTCYDDEYFSEVTGMCELEKPASCQ